MGRLKVYGGSWDLPESPTIPNPFQKFIKDEPTNETPVRPVKHVQNVHMSRITEAQTPTESPPETPVVADSP